MNHKEYFSEVRYLQTQELSHVDKPTLVFWTYMYNPLQEWAELPSSWYMTEMRMDLQI